MHDIDQTGPHEPCRPGELAIGAFFAGRYKVREKLGECGMGTVWVADQQEPVSRRVALKVVKANMSSATLLARFEQERQALALMDHPNIAKVLDAGVSGETPYFCPRCWVRSGRCCPSELRRPPQRFLGCRTSVRMQSCPR